MIIDQLKLKENGEEILKHADSMFPHTAYYVEPEKYPGGVIPWHWHSDIEVMYVAQGQLELKTNQNTYILKMGDAAFINTNVLHFQKPCAGVLTVTLNQVFDAGLISGKVQSIFDQKYVEPVLCCKEIDVLHFRQSEVRHRNIIKYIRQAQDAADEQAYGYELMVRNALSSMWLLIAEETGEQVAQKQLHISVGEERLKNMMRYIQTHYMDKVKLLDIANAANISEREAVRTFNNHLKQTPFGYLMEYRIRMAMLRLRETNDTVSQIAYDCGFSSASYFAKEFKRRTGGTALEYKKNL